MESNKVLGIIPAYNEEPRIAKVVQGTLKHIPALVIDDGSQDGTIQAVKGSGAEVLEQIPNQGKGVALRRGFQNALDSGYEAVITLDADGQHDPGEIPGFLEVFETQKPDLIIGKRDFNQIPPVRRLANSLGRWSFSWAVGQPIADNQSGYRLLSRRMMEAVLDSQESGFEFEVEMIVTCIQAGYSLEWVPICTIYRDEGSHIHPIRHTLEFTRMVLQTRKRMKNV
ncbi:MAG: glycosyltransferase family 2 protein [Anaerolineales bacterium]|nr:glycosyltransferase family 2 protein [Anaerolineales bacterium]